jgi:hypothetical protein
VEAGLPWEAGQWGEGEEHGTGDGTAQFPSPSEPLPEGLCYSERRYLWLVHGYLLDYNKVKLSLLFVLTAWLPPTADYPVGFNGCPP